MMETKDEVIKEAKGKIRKEVSIRLGRLTEVLRKAASEHICKIIAGLKDFVESNVVMFYLAKRDEVDTTPLIQTSMAQDKMCLVPVIEGEDIVPSQYQCEMKKNAYGILEPVSCNSVPIDEIDLVIVPGRAFDKNGNRIGRGKGYYDRFLSRLKATTKTIGVCFECQLFPSLPVCQYDIPVGRVVSA